MRRSSPGRSAAPLEAAIEDVSSGPGTGQVARPVGAGAVSLPQTSKCGSARDAVGGSAHVLGQRCGQRTEIALELVVAGMRLERRFVHVERSFDLDLNAMALLTRPTVSADDLLAFDRLVHRHRVTH